MTERNEREGRRLLPPITMLASFVHAADSGSFSRAGTTMGLTQSAVSRQIALLEAWLGLRLFERQGRRVALTPEGRVYADAIAPALADVRRATRRAMTARADRPLAIATLPGFGMRWLAPRLPALTAAHPEIVIDFSARADSFDLDEEGFDAAFHFGADDWPGATHDLLFREETIAVVSPRLLASHPIGSARDLAGVPLLSQTARKEAWRRWFAQHDVAAPADPIGLVFDQFLMLAHAVAAGAGAALLPSFLIGPELASGALIAPLAGGTATPGAYWLVYAPARLEDRRFRSFRDWVLEEARSMAQTAR